MEQARRAAPHAAVVPLSRGRPAVCRHVCTREQGALVPTRVVHSAKSWPRTRMSTAPRRSFLGRQESGRILSPVEVSARFGHIREAWTPRGPSRSRPRKSFLRCLLAR
jgi:hypothetical protein